MLSPRQARFAFVPLMVAVMSAVISLAMTALHQGLGPGFAAVWLHTWALAFAIALPTAWLAVPGVQKLLGQLTHETTIPSVGEKIPETGQ